MTASRDHRDVLLDMVGACRSLLQFAEGMTLDDDLADEKTRFAVMRAFEILGEAVRHMPEPLKQARPEIPWRVMAAVRSRIVHGDFGIDDTILFTSIRQDIRPHLPALEALTEDPILRSPTTLPIGDR